MEAGLIRLKSNSLELCDNVKLNNTDGYLVLYDSSYPVGIRLSELPITGATGSAGSIGNTGSAGPAGSVGSGIVYESIYTEPNLITINDAINWQDHLVTPTLTYSGTYKVSFSTEICMKSFSFIQCRLIYGSTELILNQTIISNDFTSVSSWKHLVLNGSSLVYKIQGRGYLDMKNSMIEFVKVA